MNPQQRYIAKLRAEGRCIQCAKPALPGQRMCSEHRGAVNAYQRERNAARAQSGRCRLCSKLAALGYVHCHEHMHAQWLQRLERERVEAWGYLLRCRVERGQPDVI